MWTEGNVECEEWGLKGVWSAGKVECEEWGL